MLFYANIPVNIARKMKCYISKSKLILCEQNAFYFSEIGFTNFTLHEIKQCIVCFGTPAMLLKNFIHPVVQIIYTGCLKKR